MRARWAGLIGLCAACSAPQRSVLPVLPDTASVVILFGSDVPSAFGADLPDVPLELEVPTTAQEIVVAYYRSSLASLGLPSGAFASAPESTLELPEPALLQTLDGQQRFTQPPRLFAEFRLPKVAPETCFAEGGCFLEGRCGVPCAVDRPSRPSIDPFPTVPSLTPCPSGWQRERVAVSSLEGSTTSFDVCQPFVGTTSCAAGLEHFLGRGCGAVDACPAGDWPAVAPAPGVLFVQPGGLGDGHSSAAPLPSIAAAVAAGASSIVLSRGTFPTSVALSRDVRLEGVCAAETVLVPAGAEVLRVQGAHVELSHLSIRGGDPQIEAFGAQLGVEAVHFSGAPSRALWFKEGSRARIRASAIVESGFVALSAESSSVSLDNSVVRDIRGDAAIYAGRGSTLSINRSAILFTSAERVQGLVNDGWAQVSASAIKGAGWHGIFSPRGSKLELSDVVVQDVIVDPRRAERRGYGVTVDEAELLARRVLVERTVGTAFALHFGARATIQDLVVREVSKASDDHTDGLYLSDASAEVQRVFISRVRGTALDVVNSARGQISDLIAVDAAFPELNTRGVYVGVDAGLSLSRAYLAQNSADGVALLSPSEATTVLSDVVVESSGIRGLWISDLRRVDLHRVLFRANAEEAILVGDPPDFPALYGTDVTVLGSAQLGVVHSSGTIELERFSIEDASFAGLALGTEQGATLKDGLIQDNAVGVKALLSVDLSQVLEHVRFFGNQRNLTIE